MNGPEFLTKVSIELVWRTRRFRQPLLQLASFLACQLTASIASAQVSVVELRIPSATFSVGSEIEAEFEVGSKAPMGAIQFDILFDPQFLDAVQIEATESLSASQGGLEFNQLEPGRIRVAIACSKPVTGTGALFSLRATAKTIGKVELGFVDAQAWESQTLRELRVETKGGNFLIEKAKLDVSNIPMWAWLGGGSILLIATAVFIFRRC